MANIAKIGSLISTVVKSGNTRKFIYSTGGSRGTFFDAFKEFNSRPFMAQKLAKRINSVSQTVKSDADSILKPLCDDIGEFGSRIKKVDKITGKIPRAIDDLTFDDAVEWIANGKITNIIGDGYGARIILNSPKDVPKLVKRLIESHKQGKIKLSLVENYRGNGINPYINGTNMRMLNELESGKNIVLNKIKNAGYTRTNTDIFINGTKIEFQIGGKYTTRFGEIEHYLYDMRSNGTPDLSKLNKSQKSLFYKMKEKYLLINRNEKTDASYKEYLTQIWKTLKTAEEKGLPFPAMPELPAGIPKILSAENLFKLEKNCNNFLLDG